MPGCIDQVEDVVASVLRVIVQPDSLGLDRNAALFLEVHVIENLGGHLPLCKGACHFEQAVGERRFTVVDMSDD